MLRRCAYIVVTVFFLSSVFPGTSIAKDAHLSDIIVTNTRDHLLVYFDAENCFTRDMNKAILNGIPTKFTFFVKLYEIRGGWFDHKIKDIRLTHTVKYNTLKSEFTLELPEQNDKEVKTKDFDETKDMMSEVVALKVEDLDKIKKGKQYKLRIKAELDKIELPFYLNYVLFFLSLWDFETDWHTVIFKY